MAAWAPAITSTYLLPRKMKKKVCTRPPCWPPFGQSSVLAPHRDTKQHRHPGWSSAQLTTGRWVEQNTGTARHLVPQQPGLRGPELVQQCPHCVSLLQRGTRGVGEGRRLGCMNGGHPGEGRCAGRTRVEWGSEKGGECRYRKRGKRLPPTPSLGSQFPWKPQTF